MSKTAMRFRNIITKLAAAREATSAVEFALIVPVLTAIVITIGDVATIATGVGEMQTAIRASIQYAMKGGTDMTVAQTQGLNAWDNEPANGTLTPTTSCLCGTTSADCQLPCSDNTSPKMYITVTATGTLGGDMISKSETVTQQVRVR